MLPVGSLISLNWWWLPPFVLAFFVAWLAFGNSTANLLGWDRLSPEERYWYFDERLRRWLLQELAHLWARARDRTLR
jgi:hypothetical protein